MTSSQFQMMTDPSDEDFEDLAIQFPTNPFYTTAFARHKKMLGFQSIVFRESSDIKSSIVCPAFLRSGAMTCSIEIPSLPAVPADHAFWNYMYEASGRLGVFRLSIGTFASPSCAIPLLVTELGRKRRVEYSMSLQGSELWRSMRKGHKWSIKQGEKAGLRMRIATDREALSTHADLIASSMERRVGRGEDLSLGVNLDHLYALLEAGSGKLFQAMLSEEVVASNLILLAKKGAYNQTQGATAKGLSIGAPQFLIYSIGNYLRDSQFEVFNLGGTDQLGSGLERFKDGFGEATLKVDLESAEVQLYSNTVRYAKASFSLMKRLWGH